jgi:hypothetical protein
MPTTLPLISRPMRMSACRSPMKRFAHAAAIQQQQAGQQVFGIGAHGGRAGLDHAPFAASRQASRSVLSVPTCMRATARRRGAKSQKFSGDGHLAGQNDGFCLVDGLAQGGRVGGQLRAVLHAHGATPASQSLRHQSFKK